MRLSEFIHDMLYEIALGVEIARARSHEIAAIAPESISGERVSERTYIDFEVAVVVGESDKTAKAGDGRHGADIDVATIRKDSDGKGGKAEGTSTASQQQNHRGTLKVPVNQQPQFREP